MIIFTGTGRSGTGLYSKLFQAHHEYQVERLMQLIKALTPDYNQPATDPLSAFDKRLRIIATQLLTVDLPGFRDSSNPYIHFLDALYVIDPDIRIVLGLRDGRDFAVSGVTRGYHTPKYSFFSMAPEKDDPHSKRWPSLNPIEKMAWIWVYRNQKALSRLENVPKENYHIVRLEDLTSGTQEAEKHIVLLEDFVGMKMDRQWLKVSYNRNATYALPPKEEWTPEMNRSFLGLGGEMMRRFGYIE